MRCLEIMKITEILRLKEMNLFTYRDIGQSVGCSKTTVGEILSRCKECGLKYSDAITMSQDQINELIYPESFVFPFRCLKYSYSCWRFTSS